MPIKYICDRCGDESEPNSINGAQTSHNQQLIFRFEEARNSDSWYDISKPILIKWSVLCSKCYDEIKKHLDELQPVFQSIFNSVIDKKN